MNIKEEIINSIDRNKGMYMGEIAKEMSLSYTNCMKYVMELKKEGVIMLQSNPAKYILTRSI